MAYIDTSKVTIPKGFFEDLNVPKLLEWLNNQPTADVQEVRHKRCDVCSGKEMLTQDGYTCNGYYIEINDELQELTVWVGDECMAVFPIDYCPKCGDKLSRKE